MGLLNRGISYFLQAAFYEQGGIDKRSELRSARRAGTEEFRTEMQWVESGHLKDTEVDRSIILK